MNLILGMLLGIAAQFLTFVQLQGRWKFDWMKENPWWMVLLGIPISFMFMKSVRCMVAAYNGQIWPSRLIGFSLSVTVFTAMSYLLFKEPLTAKTGVCLFLGLLIILVQIFWK